MLQLTEFLPHRECNIRLQNMEYKTQTHLLKVFSAGKNTTESTDFISFAPSSAMYKLSSLGEIRNHSTSVFSNDSLLDDSTLNTIECFYV